MKKISIIVPVYNVERYLKRCVDSILEQSFKEFELILVNDGSTDRSRYICDEYLKLDNRIKVIHKKNEGLPFARNAGLDIATGEYIGFVDSDDYINKDMYNILYNIAILNESEIVVCDYKEVFDSSKYNIKRDIAIKEFNQIQSLEELYSSNGVKMIVAWNKLYKKNLFNNLRYKSRIHEDEFIAHELLYLSKKTTYVDCELYYYFQRNDSIMGSKFNIKRLDLIEALEERIKFFQKHNLEEIKFKCEYDYTQNLINLYYKATKELQGCEKKLKDINYKSRKILPNIIINNPYYNIREKIALLLFLINKKLYKLVFLKNN